jgi:hypothetical protein
MRVGVVCEGPTDRHAIVCFLGTSLTARGIAPVFIDIQPETDRTNPPEGGWGAVLNWLRNNPPKSRVDAYFGRGLFGGSLSAKRCDVMVFQMDTDILSDHRFQDWVTRNLGYEVVDSGDSMQRGSEIRSIIEIAGDFVELSVHELQRHIPAPAVESTETWCVAVFSELPGDPEQLRGQDLCREFMTALHRSENRRIQQFVHVDKQPDRRRRYCEKHSAGFERLEAQCLHYRGLVDSIFGWSVGSVESSPSN